MWYLKVSSSLLIAVALICMIQNTVSFAINSKSIDDQWTKLADSIDQSYLKKMTKKCEEYIKHFDSELENIKSSSNEKLNEQNKVSSDIVDLAEKIKTKLKGASFDIGSVRKLIQNLASRFRDSFNSIVSFVEFECEPVYNELEKVKKTTVDKKKKLNNRAIKSFGNRYDLRKLADKILKTSLNKDKFTDNYDKKKQEAKREFSLLWKTLNYHIQSVNQDALDTLNAFIKGMISIKSVKQKVKSLRETALNQVKEGDDLVILQNAVELAKALQLKFEDELNLNSGELSYSDEQKNEPENTTNDVKSDTQDSRQNDQHDSNSTIKPNSQTKNQEKMVNNDEPAEKIKPTTNKSDSNKTNLIVETPILNSKMENKKEPEVSKNEATISSLNSPTKNLPLIVPDKNSKGQSNTSVKIPVNDGNRIRNKIKTKKLLLTWEELINLQNPKVSSESKNCVDILQNTMSDLDDIKVATKGAIQMEKSLTNLINTENNAVKQFSDKTVNTNRNMASSLIKAADEICSKVTPIDPTLEDKFKNDQNIKRVSYLLGKNYDPNQYVLKILQEANDKPGIDGIKKKSYYKMAQIAYNLKRETKEMDDTALYAMNKIYEGNSAVSNLSSSVNKEKASKACYIRNILLEKENEEEKQHKEEYKDKIIESLNKNNNGEPLKLDVNLDSVDKIEPLLVVDDKEPKITNEEETNTEMPISSGIDVASEETNNNEGLNEKYKTSNEENNKLSDDSETPKLLQNERELKENAFDQNKPGLQEENDNKINKNKNVKLNKEVKQNTNDDQKDSIKYIENPEITDDNLSNDNKLRTLRKYSKDGKEINEEYKPDANKEDDISYESEAARILRQGPDPEDGDLSEYEPEHLEDTQHTNHANSEQNMKEPHKIDNQDEKANFEYTVNPGIATDQLSDDIFPNYISTQSPEDKSKTSKEGKRRRKRINLKDGTESYDEFEPIDEEHTDDDYENDNHEHTSNLTKNTKLNEPKNGKKVFNENEDKRMPEDFKKLEAEHQEPEVKEQNLADNGLQILVEPENKKSQNNLPKSEQNLIEPKKLSNNSSKPSIEEYDLKEEDSYKELNDEKESDKNSNSSNTVKQNIKHNKSSEFSHENLDTIESFEHFEVPNDNIIPAVESFEESSSSIQSEELNNKKEFNGYETKNYNEKNNYNKSVKLNKEAPTFTNIEKQIVPKNNPSIDIENLNSLEGVEKIEEEKNNIVPVTESLKDNSSASQNTDNDEKGNTKNKDELISETPRKDSNINTPEEQNFTNSLDGKTTNLSDNYPKNCSVEKDPIALDNLSRKIKIRNKSMNPEDSRIEDFENFKTNNEEKPENVSITRDLNTKLESPMPTSIKKKNEHLEDFENEHRLHEKSQNLENAYNIDTSMHSDTLEDPQLHFSDEILQGDDNTKNFKNPFKPLKKRQKNHRDSVNGIEFLEEYIPKDGNDDEIHDDHSKNMKVSHEELEPKTQDHIENDHVHSAKSPEITMSPEINHNIDGVPSNSASKEKSQLLKKNKRWRKHKDPVSGIEISEEYISNNEEDGEIDDDQSEKTKASLEELDPKTQDLIENDYIHSAESPEITMSPEIDHNIDGVPSNSASKEKSQLLKKNKRWRKHKGPVRSNNMEYSNSSQEQFADGRPQGYEGQEIIGNKSGPSKRRKLHRKHKFSKGDFEIPENNNSNQETLNSTEGNIKLNRHKMFKTLRDITPSRVESWDTPPENIVANDNEDNANNRRLRRIRRSKPKNVDRSVDEPQTVYDENIAANSHYLNDEIIADGVDDVQNWPSSDNSEIENNRVNEPLNNAEDSFQEQKAYNPSKNTDNIENEYPNYIEENGNYIGPDPLKQNVRRIRRRKSKDNNEKINKPEMNTLINYQSVPDTENIPKVLDEKNNVTITEEELPESQEKQSNEDHKKPKRKIRRITTYMVNRKTNERIPINTYLTQNEEPQGLEEEPIKDKENLVKKSNSDEDEEDEENSSFLFQKYNSDRCKHKAYDQFKRVISNDARQIGNQSVLNTSELRSSMLAKVKSALKKVKSSETFDDVDQSIKAVSDALKVGLKQIIRDLRMQVIPLAQRFIKTTENLKELYKKGPPSTYNMLNALLDSKTTDVIDSNSGLSKLLSTQFDIDTYVNDIFEKPDIETSLEPKKTISQKKLLNLFNHMETATSNIDCFVLSAMATIGAGSDALKLLKSGRLIMTNRNPRAMALKDAMELIKSFDKVLTDTELKPQQIVTKPVENNEDDDDDEDPDEVAQKNEEFLKTIPHLDRTRIPKKIPHRRQSLGVIVIHPNRNIEYKEVNDTSQLKKFVKSQTKGYKQQPKFQHPKFLKVNSKKLVDTMVEDIKKKAIKNGMTRKEMVDEIIQNLSRN